MARGMLNPGMTLLLCEDNPDNTMLMQAILERLGFAVHCAVDGEEGLAYCEQSHFDLVLTDIEMPRLDGFGLLEKLRQREARLGRPPAVVVAVTAYASVQDRHRFLAAGFNEFLAKPFRIDDVRALLSRLDPAFEPPVQ